MAAVVLPVLLPLLAAAAALAVSWQRWINPFVDSGRELAVPWRLLQGERLYRDITYYYGPLGPWANALALRLFGNGWVILQLVCAALAAVIFLLLFRITRRAGSLFSATAATTLAAALCMGAPRGGAFIFPYSSSSLFALAGALLALDAISAPNRMRGALIMLGLSVALTSRLEIGAAAAAALVIADLRSRPGEKERTSFLAVLAAVLFAGAVYWAACAGIPWRDLLTDGPFGPFLLMPEEWKRFYLNVSGLGAPGKAAGRVAVSLLLDGLILAGAGWLALPKRGRPALRYSFSIAGLLLFAVYAYSRLSNAGSDLPPFMAILPLVAAAAALALLRRPLGERDRSRFVLFFFSAAVASRVLFGISVGPRMASYSALPLPGLLATAAVLAFDLLAPRLPAPRVFQWRLAAVFSVIGCVFLVQIERADNPPGVVAVETPAGTLRLPAREAGVVAGTLAYLERNAHDGDTLTAFPESGFFNFVLRLRSPLQQDLVLPGVLSGSREAAVARRVGRAGPRYVLLCNRPTPEYGPVAFGRDYAAGLWSTVEDRYRLSEAFGPAGPTVPVGDPRFFIRVYSRAPGEPEPVKLATAGPRRQPGLLFAFLQ
jgi:hypothetical protein